MKFIKALLLTVAGWISLAIGDILFHHIGLNKQVADILVYIVPMLYILFLVKRFNLMDKYKNTKKYFKGIALGWPFLLPVYFVLTGNMSVFSAPLKSNWLLVLVLLIILCLCVAFFEESLFRNVIYNYLKPNHAFIVSSLLFGLIHIGNITVVSNQPISVITQVIYAFMIGILLQAIYNRTNNLYSVITLHATIDFISFLPILFNVTTKSSNTDISIVSAVITILLVLPALIVGLIMERKNKKSLDA